MHERPDPDALLRRLALEERRQKGGKHTIFFGAAPGVGKTYAMLEAARAEIEREQRDVVVGIVETHGRFETGALVVGLELLPKRKVAYRGVEVEEFDLDAALARHPQLILMDELAHTNAEGSRHPKRWQDVDELLLAGIDVYSTMNVQHVESLNDVIAKVTGVIVRETVPDSMLERAHELKLVDLAPDELLERLRDGKVYVPAQAQRAIENFFRKGNLIALRELALRHTAERVDAQMREYRQAQGIEQTWAVAEQILVAVSPSPYSPHLVRAARRMATSLHARWFAVYVEPTNPLGLNPAARQRLAQNLRLAEQLGAETVTLAGENATESILRFARDRNITKIIVGKPMAARWRDRFRVSIVDQIVRQSGDIDVYVTAGDPAPDEKLPRRAARSAPHLPSWGAAVVAVALSTGLALLLFDRDQLADVVMIYLLGIMVVASRLGLGPSVLAALTSVAAVDFLFVPPYYTFRVQDFRHAVTFIVMFAVAIVISGLTQRIKNQAAGAHYRELRTAALYELSREFAAARTSSSVLEAATRQLEKVFSSQVAVYTPSAGGKLTRVHASQSLGDPSERDASIAEWVWVNQKDAGLGTSTLPSATALYVPLIASGGIVGVLALTPEKSDRFGLVDERRQLDAFTAQTALALERAALSEETEAARREVEKEQLRSSLLSSVSHDLRTPLAVITGAASTLLQATSVGATSNPSTSAQPEPAIMLDEAARLDLTRSILEEAERLNRLIRNLLDMTRLDSGMSRLKEEWLPLEEVVGPALHRLDAQLVGREVRIDLPSDLPPVAGDAVLLEQAFINLLENAARHGAGPIDIRAWSSAGEVTVEIADRGPGIPAGQEALIFEKFHRAVSDGSPSGAGLGLSICRAIVAAHGGRIWAANRDGGGATFRFTLRANADTRAFEASALSLPALEPLV
jgi:two-component system, OmpR family, sensor histidine kinase KdpD